MADRSGERTIRHSVRAHQHDPHFIVNCTLCGASYKKWNSFKKHLSRKHKGNQIFDTVEEDGNLDIEFQSIDFPLHDNTDDIKTRLERNTASLILDLKESHNLTQASINDMLVSFQLHQKQHMAFYSEILKEKLSEKLTLNEVNEIFQCKKIKDMFQGSNMFNNLDTAYKQHKFYTEKFGLVDPKEVVLGIKPRWKPDGREMKVVDEEFLGYYVPFLDSLTALLSLPEVENEVFRKHNPNKDKMTDFCDGKYIKSNPAFNSNEALQIIAYHDDMEIVNPIGSHVKIHKISIFYWVLCNIRPRYRSRLSAIQLLAVAKTKHLRQFGIETLLKDFIESVNKLSLPNGVTLSINGSNVKLTGGLVAFLGDTPAANFVAGFKEGVGFAQRKCRSCDVTDTELPCVSYSEQVRMRNMREHIERCSEISNPTLTKKTKTYWSREYGINNKSCFGEIQNFDICKCFLHDPMHVLLEGVVHYEVQLLLRHLIFEKEYFSLDFLNGKLLTIKSLNPTSNQPCEIEKSCLISHGYKMKMTSSEMHSFVINLPYMVADCISEEDDHWKNFLRMLQILQIAHAPEISDDTVLTMKYLVACYIESFKMLHPTATVIPKMHYMVHFPEQMENFGPLRYHSCLRYEGKNGYFKGIKWKCFKNLPKSLAFRHQSWMCRQQTGSFGYPSLNYLYSGDEIKEGKSVELHEEIPEVYNIVYQYTENGMYTVLESNEIKVHGSVFKPGLAALLNTGLDQETEFGIIQKIFVVNDTKLLLCQQCELDTFEYKYNSYTVITTCNFTVRNILNLWYPWPLNIITQNSKQLISFKGYGNIEFPI